MKQYRGKRKDNGEWVKGWYVKINNIHYIVLDRGCTAINCGEDSCFYISAFQNFIEVIPETVGQSTCKLDDDKKEIYQGDIDEMPNMPSSIYSRRRKVRVVAQMEHRV